MHSIIYVENRGKSEYSVKSKFQKNNIFLNNSRIPVKLDDVTDRLASSLIYNPLFYKNYILFMIEQYVYRTCHSVRVNVVKWSSKSQFYGLKRSYIYIYVYIYVYICIL